MTYLGTTDTFYPEAEVWPRIGAEDAQYLLDAAAQRFFAPDKAWRMVVLPQPATPAATAASTTPKPPAETGLVVMNCIVSPENRLSDCRLVKEQPAGRGLGSEALLIAPSLQMDPKTLPAPVNGRSTLTIRLPLPAPGA